MAAYVGLVDGHSVIVEGEDTPGMPMCDLNETHKCPYQNGFPRGVNLHDFAKEMRHWEQRTGRASHPNCRPCLACSEMDFAGYIIAMAHFHRHYDNCPKDHGVVEARNVAFSQGASMHLYHDYSAGNYPYDVPKDFPGAWGRRPYTWWTDPVWAELNVPNRVTPNHRIERSSFNNTHCGTAVAFATSGVYTIPTLPVTGNVFLVGGVGLNGASRTYRDLATTITDFVSPFNDHAATRTQGVGSPNDGAEPAGKEKFNNPSNPMWNFNENFLSNAPMTVLMGAAAQNNIITGPVRLHGSDLENADSTPFKNNVINAPGQDYCIAVWPRGVKTGISDNVAFGCHTCMGFRKADGTSGGIARRMKLADCNIGLMYMASGPDSKNHDATRVVFTVEDTKIYAMSTGNGVGMTNPKVHSAQLGEPGAPDWWNVGPKFETLGHSSVTLWFMSEVKRVEFVGFNKNKGGKAFGFGQKAPGDVGDFDMHPVFVTATTFTDMDAQSIVDFGSTVGYGTGLQQCLQIDCDGRRNSLLVDVDGSILGQPGTIVSKPWKFYDKMRYVDPMGFDTMEDLIPFPQRYDRFGDAIPFPKGVDHGTGGNLEYECLASSTKADSTPGCDVLCMNAGHWVPCAGVPGLAPGTRIVAVREDGGLIRLDALHHGWRYANGYVRTQDCKLTMHWDPAHGGSAKPESQHARRFGRVNPGEFGTHINTSRVVATKGPVYTVPGVWKDGCTEDATMKAWKCPGGQHRHLLIEVMDWDFMSRRYAPVSVEVNDQFAPQGGALNILTGPAMMWTGVRVQVFHALGYLGLRHNIYFSANPPSHLRLHLQHAPADSGVVVCVYYGLPNMIYAYVGGKKKEPLVNATPNWDNLVLTRLTPDMPHGTYYYDRVGVETGRPGYLYAVIRGSQHIDLKISHKVQLTTKISVSANWGGWKNASGDNFFNKGINGLVRNIALLIGAPPGRVKILGEGSAAKGTFWNEDTTSKAFAEWMWKQNKSMAYSPMDHWLTAPTSRGFVNATPGQLNASLLHLPEPEQRAALLQTFDKERHHLIQAALSNEGKSWQSAMGLLTSDEQRAVYDMRAQEELAANGACELDKVLMAQKLKEDKAALGTPCQATGGQPCDLPIMLAVDDEDYTPAAAKPVAVDEVADAVAISEDESNKAEMKIEAQADGMFQSGAFTNAGSGPSLLELHSGAAVSYPILNAKVDNVPHMNAPLGWRCNASWYSDGSICHCDCGIWDPDCDKGSIIVPVTSNSSRLQLLDKKQVGVLMNLVDADGNANGVLDGNELITLQGRLGQSALFGVAQLIIQAQERGYNLKSTDPNAMRLGDFAMLAARPTAECGHLLKDGRPVNASLATFMPVCVRDSEFKPVVKQATGRCAILPEMQVGSQCMVPGHVGVHGVSYSRNNDTNATNAVVPSPAAVCGSLSRIFKKGQGVGGHRSAGLGVTTAKWAHAGGEFIPGTDLPFLDMNQVGTPRLDKTFARGFSFYATIRVDRHESNMPLFSFGIPRGSQHDSWRHQHISVFTRRESNEMLGLMFHTGYSTRDHNRYFHKTAVLRVAETTTLLFTVAPSGKLVIMKKGILVGEKDFRTNKMAKGPYDYMWIAGGSQGKCLWRSCHDNYGFEGMITDIRVWDKVVTWNEAAVGSQPGVPPVDTGDDPAGDLPASCIASRRNTWDFICDDEVPKELAADYGVGTGSGSEADEQVKRAFDQREDQGEVTVCGSSSSIKTGIFHGRFGDGLTGEYFRMRMGCNPPFLFGRIPKLVRVDKTIDFDNNMGFRAAFNEYAVRWTGKILIDAAGTYKFKLESKDGSFLAVGGRLLINNGHCHSPRTIEGTTTLTKGGHQISILYFNRGPRGTPQGKIRLSYYGVDTGNTWITVPQAKLGSAPMRMSKLGRHDQDDATNVTEAVKLGQFVYDEKTRVGVMPVGACDFQCRAGNRKDMSAPFRFFCKAPAVVSFVANVNQDADKAMVWLDTLPVQIWDVSPAASLVEQAALAANTATEKTTMEEAYMLRQAERGNATAALLHSLSGAAMPSFIIAPSAPSPDFQVTAGEHTILVQGRPGEDEAFALQGLRLEKGRDSCVFFLEGKDKLPEDC
uniref:PA14 domain-containing protein n=1 Tax=Alexandrium andersonii TaxID=327968 RepID=A0A7S2NK41_9DINO